MKKLLVVLCAMILVFGVPMSALSAPINVDQYVFEPDPSLDYHDLKASVDMTGSDDTLTITLTNLSVGSATATDFSPLILTGIGFNLPSNTVVGGSIDAPLGDNFSGTPNPYWGWSSKIFNPLPAVDPSFTTNVTVSTLNAYVYAPKGEAFDLSSGGAVDGPKHGIVDTTFFGRYPFPVIFDRAIINLNLTDSPSDWDDFINTINDGDVVVAFGSPTAAVPVPSAMLLLGSGLIGMFGIRRKFKK